LCCGLHKEITVGIVLGVDQVPSEGQLEGMPEPYGYWLVRQAGEVLVGFGRRVMFHFDERDVGMRNLAVVALTEAGAKGTEVAALFGLSREHVSRLRGRAVNGGSRALLPRGAPRKLSQAAERRALELSEGGETGAQIARRLGVSEATISRLLARRGAVVVQGELGPAEADRGVRRA
jgi:transposase